MENTGEASIYRAFEVWRFRKRKRNTMGDAR